MGDPKYPRRAWRKPKRPFNYELKMEELKTLGTFGLRTKRELWKAHTELSRVRHQARSLLALRKEDREKKEPVLMRSLERIGLVKPGSTLDDVLNLGVDDLLKRRLQTIVAGKLGFRTPYHARQAVVHGHVMIGERRVDIPSYTVTVEEETEIRFAPESTLPKVLEKEAKHRSAEAHDDDAEDMAAAGAEDGAAPGTEAAEQAPPGDAPAAEQAGAGGAPAAEQAPPGDAPAAEQAGAGGAPAAEQAPPAAEPAQAGADPPGEQAPADGPPA